MEAQSKRNNERAAATASRIFVPIQVESPIRRIYLCERGTLDTARRADIETDRESESIQSQYDALHVARLNTQLETTKNKLKTRGGPRSLPLPASECESERRSDERE